MKLEPTGKPPIGETSSAMLSAMMDEAAIVQRRTGETPRDYLGGSRLGETCERRLGYEYTHAKADEGSDFSGRALRVFQRGHDGEARMARYVRLAGFDLVTERPAPDGGEPRQIGWGVAPDPETGRPRIAGHLDGVILGWKLPEGGDPNSPHALWAGELSFPALWESKCLKAESWRSLYKHGLRKDKPDYFAQVQVYMAFKGLAWALFTAENADTCEVYAEIVLFDVRAAQAASDRGLRVVTAPFPEALPRACREPDDHTGLFCPYRERCWTTAPKAQAKGANVAVRVSW